MSGRIAIVDYGMGNLRSVLNAIEAVGGVADLVAEPAALTHYDRLILPGVGAFGQAIDNLRRTGLDRALEERRQAGATLLGICLGMQLMCSDSDEEGLHAGLGWFAAHVRRFPDTPGLPVPHMGWNAVDFARPDRLLAGLESGGDAYFIHGYRVTCGEPADVLATCAYGVEFACMIQRENLYGIQFHPEKSQNYGLTLLRNFVNL
ncbi:MAG: imidazole glycerol phosphate synthase subunit HisH [Thiobacillaceae bacterium]|jgi:glutamine amidotransferase|nr:imidazole glycerol phosphate synthase subunit HisH [Thiobacillaceae bacterium]